ncbi:hypothetical protein FKM82_028192 [Ascaphus truei]
MFQARASWLVIKGPPGFLPGVFYNARASPRLRRRLLHEAHGGRPFPEKPPAHQRNPERERGARRPLGGDHGPDAGAEKTSPVPHGAPGTGGVIIIING